MGQAGTTGRQVISRHPTDYSSWTRLWRTRRLSSTRNQSILLEQAVRFQASLALAASEVGLEISDPFGRSAGEEIMDDEQRVFQEFERAGWEAVAETYSDIMSSATPEID